MSLIIYQPPDRLYLFFRKLLQVKKRCTKYFCFCRQMINRKLLKGNRLSGTMTPKTH